MLTSAKRCFVGDREKTNPSTLRRLETSGFPAQQQLAAAGAVRVDPLAGIPGRAEAEEALTNAINRRLPGCAAVFIVDRIHLLNDCFGYDMGDRLLDAFHDRLRRSLGPADRIFRWSGTSFVVLMEGRRTAAEVRGELERVAGGDAEITVMIGHGSLALATAASWAVFPLYGTTSKESMVRCFDHYIAANMGR
ncbi:MAG: diguanylate cyclase [Acidobacteriales bacterium]|nr:diguanylate cyclase [Terriglobales bacterium]